MGPNKVSKQKLSKNFVGKYKVEKEEMQKAVMKQVLQEQIKPFEKDYYDSMMDKYRSSSDLFLKPKQRSPFKTKNHRYLHQRGPPGMLHSA